MYLYALLLVFWMAVINESCWAGSGQYKACFQQSGKKYRISPLVLEAIALTESGVNPNAINHRNRNGTIDIGIMQINSWWLGRLKSYGINKDDLFNACINIEVGAWILANNIADYGYNWTAIAVYNTGRVTKKNTAIRKNYINRVKGNLLHLMGN